MMLLLSFLILFSIVAKAQSKDTIAIYDRVAPHSLYKEYYYPNNKNQGIIKGNNIGVSNTVNLFKQNDGQNTTVDFSEFNNSTIVVIDNKIYSTKDVEYINLDPTKIKDLKVIKDQKSKTGVKAIIFIQLKKV